ncbi:hypothetical protein ACIQBJ_33830 [Kitasatospora sp. NPDC088391]|uniref:hypothetical protein n=1 Tax=Kitasatospora sp. NPDC088391 TaxID=3364074 RepID=UPI00381231F6
MESERVARLAAVAERFVVGLRMNEGFDEVLLRQLREEIDRCGAAWRERDEVPKRGALILAELYAAIDACAWLYTGETRERIVDAAVEVHEAVVAALD